MTVGNRISIRSLWWNEYGKENIILIDMKLGRIFNDFRDFYISSWFFSEDEVRSQLVIDNAIFGSLSIEGDMSDG